MLMPGKVEWNRGALLLFLMGLLSSCSGEEGKEREEMTRAERKAFRDSLMKENRKLSRSEEYAIEDYIERRGWDMKKTGTGLRYMIEEKGTGKKAERGMVAKVNYRVELLSGQLLYSSDSTGAKSFLIGKDREITGLHRGIQFLREGGEAVFIMPYHLAHGLVGDTKKVPMHATLVYHIELLELKERR